ncbi:xylulokinase [Neokomagataea thailandica]|uniref:Xylulose kinase n=1 Tax=Neokomagataea tanensis NBRC 106556 TaxID=1223519 RepID=A0ABQ0QH33_9PROT|nr:MULTISPECIES: xylulokinase [Neokomagataea]GBR44502.1 glycerol kinase [Neokomagataea tanensis NBRC 106556]
MYIGIDAGTSGLKAILVDEQQHVLADRTVRLSVQSPQSGWSEQDPEQWWKALLEALDGLKNDAPHAMAQVKGIGLSGQQHGAVLLDAHDQVLRPCILWNDVRSDEECLDFEESFPQSRAVCGNIAMPGFTAPKILWVRQHEPEIFKKIRHVLLPKAWLRFKLCGEKIEDMSDASGTLWLNVGQRRWSDAALNATGLDVNAMPRLCEGTDAAGTLSTTLTTRWGMERSPLIAGSAGDNAASAVGLGAVNTGDAFLSLGTSGVLWCTTDRFRPNTNSAIHAMCHALPHTWHQMGVTLSAASSLAWWAEINHCDVSTLLSELPDHIERPSRALFLPYLNGERTPYNDGHVRGAFLGLDRALHRAELTQAVLEGVAHSFRDALDGLHEAGSILQSADVIGGGSRSRLWISILASVLNLPLNRLSHGEQGGAFGAARLARLAVTHDTLSTICTPPLRAETLVPHPGLVEAYAQSQERYRAAYPLLRDISTADHGVPHHAGPHGHHYGHSYGRRTDH